MLGGALSGPIPLLMLHVRDKIPAPGLAIVAKSGAIRLVLTRDCLILGISGTIPVPIASL